MDAQVVKEGRHQGGRAPYGYVAVDDGAHPNPRKAAEGFQLRVLAIDDESADVVRRIFAEYLEGVGDRAIAKGLNQDGFRARPSGGRTRIGIGSPMVGKAVRFDRFRRTLGTPRTPSSGVGPNRRRC